MARTNDTAIFEKSLLQFIGTPDPMLAMLEWMTAKLMLIEASAKAGALKGKHSRDRRTHFSGTRVRRFDTRLGTVYLLVPKLREGGYIPFFVTERKRSEQALLEVVQEAFINGVSTRKIERLASSLGIENISASQVSEINKGLDEMVAEFRTRPLTAEYPVIWIDALYEKIRCGGKVRSHAVMVICGINSSGGKEILAIEPMETESEETYTVLFESLKDRGVRDVWLAVSDAHRGLQAAVKKCFLGACWQRCKVHFMRNILAHVPAKEKEAFAGKLKSIWTQPDRESALRFARALIEETENKIPKAAECLEDGLEDSLQFFEFPELDSRKTSSTNILERLNREIRRRTRVVGIFPSVESYVRLVTCYMIENAEDWQTDRSYISVEALAAERSRQQKVA